MIKKSVSVIIPAYNEERDIEKCFLSLKKQSQKSIEIILVDDGSTDKTISIAKKHGIKILRQNHQGPGAARNFGAKKSHGKILVFVDADMHFPRDYIKNLIKPILNDKKNKIIGTTHDYEIATNTANWVSDLWGKVRVSKENAKDVKIFRAIRKDKFFELGCFDSKYGYADDQTFWFKYKIKPVVAKNTLCYHKNSETLKSTFKQARWIGASWKERFLIFRMPLLKYIFALSFLLFFAPLAFVKSIKEKKYSFCKRFVFYLHKFYGYSLGLLRAVFLNAVWK